MSDISIITQSIELKFDDIEQAIFSGELFSPWRGSFEVKKTIIKKENADIKCDFDIRLKHWPQGVYIKVYKHKALGVLPYVKDHHLCEQYLDDAPVPCKFWKESFYFSNISDLDQGRYVLLDGNKMSVQDTHRCIQKIIEYIQEVNTIVN